MFRKQILLAIVILALSQTAFTKLKHLSQDPVEHDGVGAGSWLGLNTGLTLTGKARLLSLDAANSRAEYRIFDYGNGGTCRVRAYIGTLFFFFDFQTNSQLICSQAIIARITQQGHVLFLDPTTGQYRYTTQSFRLTDVMNIKGSSLITQVSSVGVQIAATKAYATSNQDKDAFRIYSKASDSNSNYPEKFYYLESDATRNSFVQTNSSSLTLKATNWEFKKTSNKANFQEIDAVNFIPVQEPGNGYEGQFITGRYFNQNTCLFGVVDTYRFFKGTASFPQMYAGTNEDLDFSCGPTYQGIIMKGATPKFYYAINRNSGEIRVCGGLPSRIGDITSTNKFGTSCEVVSNPKLALVGNEYYGAVDVTNVFGKLFAVVTIRVKDTGVRVRQVLANIGNAAGLPTFDTDTYFYAVSDGIIWRLPQRWGPGGASVTLAFFDASSVSAETE